MERSRLLKSRRLLAIPMVLVMLAAAACGSAVETPTAVPIDAAALIQQAIAAQPQGASPEDVAKAVRETLAQQPAGVTVSEVASAISSAMADSPGVTEAAVARAIASALSAKPGVTEAQVAAAIANELSARPGVTAAQVADAISGALSDSPGVTQAQVQDAIKAALAQVVVATDAPSEPKAGGIDLGGTLVYPTNEGIISFDIHWTGTYNAVQPIGSTYNSLLTYDQINPGVILPELANSWKVDSAGTTYTFDLRDDVTYHRGSPFACGDAKASLDKMTNRKVSGLAGALAPYESSACLDEGTLTVTLKQRMAAFLTAMAGARFVIQPKSVADAVVASEDPRSGFEKQEAFLDGTGPFKFKSHIQGIHFEAERNANYWKPDRPYLDGYKVITFPDLTTMSAAFRARQLSTTGLAQHLEPSVAKQIIALFPGDAKLITAPRNAWHNIMINHNKKPWDDVRVRKAVWLVIDQWETIDTAIDGWGTPGAFLGPHLVFALPEKERNTYPFFKRDMAPRIAEAKALMAEAGFPDGFKDEILVRFGISYQKAALTAQQDLKQIGIDVEVSTIDTATIVSLRNSGEFTMMAMPSSTPFDDPDGYWARFQCDNSSNYVGYCNTEFDTLFEQQSGELDLKKRIDLTHKIERILLTDLPDHRPYYWWQATLHWDNVQSWEMKLADWTYNHDRLESTWCKEGKCR